MTYKLLILCVFLGSCSAHRMIETHLYFGQSIPGGGMITEKEWNSFKEDKIAKVFKEGSTAIYATGTWFDPDTHQLITEPTWIVSHLYKRSGGVSKQIDSLCYWYKTMFRQQSVLRIDKKVKAFF